MTKTGSGTEVLATAPQLADNSTLNVNGGTLQIAATDAANVGSGVTAKISGGSTLELAGTTSALGTATVADRANITTASAADTLLVSGGDQQVGAIGGSGTVEVDGGASLTANHITAGALVIGGDAANSAVVTIAASDTIGNPTATSGVCIGRLAHAERSVGQRGRDSASLAVADDPSSSGIGANGAALGGASLASGASVGTTAVPEPSTLLLLVFGVVGGLVAGRRRRKM